MLVHTLDDGIVQKQIEIENDLGQNGTVSFVPERIEAPEVISTKERVDGTLAVFDRLIEWESSLTPRDEFEQLLSEGRQLRIKFGADITAQTLHLGHAVNLRAMRELQDLGHKVVFLLGGFTTLVGDPTGRLAQRTAQTEAEIKANKQNFIEQVGMILRFDDPNLLEIHDNTDWWGEPEKHGAITLGRFFELLGMITHSQLIAREMFRKRIEHGIPIAMSELLYPILQGYDSVQLGADVTIVGSDQMFNEKMAWVFQDAAHQRRQAILCTKITLGLDGKNKQSKSIGNYVGLSHSPQEKFNRTMLLPDELISQWMDVYTNVSQQELLECQSEWKNNPLGYKQRLAWHIVEQFHGAEAANTARIEYLERRQEMKLPTEVPEVTMPSQANSTLFEVLKVATGQNPSVIRDAIRNNGVHIVTVGVDGSYSLRQITLNDRDIVIPEGTIVKFGKNKWYRFILAQ